MAEVEFESPEELVHDNASGLGLEAAKVLAGSPVATQSALLGTSPIKLPSSPAERAVWALRPPSSS